MKPEKNAAPARTKAEEAFHQITAKEGLNFCQCVLDIVSSGIMRGTRPGQNFETVRNAALRLRKEVPEGGGVYLHLIRPPHQKGDPRRKWTIVYVGSSSNLRDRFSDYINTDGTFGPRGEGQKHWIYPTAQARGFDIRVMIATTKGPKTNERRLLRMYDFGNNDMSNRGANTTSVGAGMGYRRIELQGTVLPTGAAIVGDHAVPTITDHPVHRRKDGSISQHHKKMELMSLASRILAASWCANPWLIEVAQQAQKGMTSEEHWLTLGLTPCLVKLTLVLKLAMT